MASRTGVVEPQGPAPAEPPAPRFRVSLAPAPEPSVLAPLWRELEARAAGSFFVSWSWIGLWLEMVRARFSPLLLRAELDGRVVGLGLLVPRRVRRHGVIAARQLLLHATGDEQVDELTIEYNGLLAEDGLAARVEEACFGHLLAAVPGWDECLLDGVGDAGRLERLAGPCVRLLRPRSSPCYAVDLRAVGPGSHLEALDARTRRSVRRSLKEFAALGPVAVEPPGSAAQAGEFLAELKRLHQAHWRERGRPGSFAGAFCDRFHSRLVEDAFAAGAADVLRLRAGDTTLGYTYNFLYRDRVLQYQSGFDYGRFPGRTPGLVAHVLSIEHYAARGLRVYDFLAGDAEYKQRLGRLSSELSWLVLQRDRLRFRLEDRLRDTWRTLRAARVRRSPAPAAPAGAAEPAEGGAR